MRELPSALRVLFLPTVFLQALVALPVATVAGPMASVAHAQEASTGVLRVNAPIPGSQVYVDNKLVGEVPVTTYLAPGSHTVRVTADNFDPFVRKVTISTGRTTELNADLLPGAGTVEFVVEPPGATLTLNDREEYPTPVRLRELAPGTYSWTLEAPAHEPTSGEFEFQSGKNLLIVQDLPSSSGRFSIVSRPDGAAVFLDGTRVGETPLDLDGVAPGVHQVLLDLKGHATSLRTVDTGDGSKGVVDVRLSESGASLTVKTNSAAAKVRLNGVKVGEGRTVRIPEIERGRYTLSVAAPGQDPVETRIEIPERGGSWWKAKVGDSKGAIKEYTPVTRSWIFWAGAGAVATGAAVGSVVAYNATIPDPIPAGDIVVSMP